ncbi:hypothetical protein A3K73_02940 [Candidatus Pacearchaeota archaeon RBG_13_36_9]|nr:MAG: hypothetical protein A3K73_02940 [Candidatus Pacearchaeota archaeon RBG_13_36_9]
MGDEYLKRVLKESDRILRGLSRQEKVRALDAYKLGLEKSFRDSYQDRFPAPADISIEDKYASFFKAGLYVGVQFGPLEVESAREFLLSQIEKRKKKFSRTSWLEEYYTLFGKSWWKK